MKPRLRGPLFLSGFHSDQNDACSIAIHNTVPQIVCVAFSNGTICHSLLLDNEEEDSEVKMYLLFYYENNYP